MKKIALLLFTFIGLSLFGQKKLTSALTERYSGSTWQNNNEIEYNYDTSGNLTEEIEFFWETTSSQWEAANKISYSYNTNNKVEVALSEEFDFNSNSFIESSRTNYTYNTDGDLIQFLEQDWSGTDWENSYKTDLTYTNNQVSGGLSYEWDGNNWNEEQNVTINYNGNETFNSFVSDDWNGTDWVTDGRVLASYDASDNMILQERQFWSGSDWITESKVEYMYDTNGNIISEKDYDLDNGTFVINYEETATFDSNDLMSNYTHPFKDKSGIDYLIDPMNVVNKILTLSSTFGERTTYNYEEATAGIKDFGSIVFSVYPNPVSSYVNVDDSTFSLKNITIFNLLGQKLLSTTENKLNIENLKDGAYLLKMETISGEIMTKRILKK